MEKEVNKQEKILNSVYKCAKTATASIDAITTEIKDDSFKDVLAGQFQGFKDYESKSACRLYNLGLEPKTMNSLSKAMIWSNIKLKSLTSDNVGQFSNMLVQGINMGILDVQKEINDHASEVDEESRDIATNFLSFMTDNINQLKTYL